MSRRWNLHPAGASGEGPIDRVRPAGGSWPVSTPPIVHPCIMLLLAILLAGAAGCDPEDPARPQIPPVARFSVAPETGEAGTLFSLDASASTDDEDPPERLLVRWDWEDDGIWDTEPKTEKQVSWRYPDSTLGPRTIRLQVSDTGGRTGEATRGVFLIAAPPRNQAPVAHLVVEPPYGASGTIFIFDASRSSDPDDPPDSLEVRWDWEDNGVWDTEFGQTRVATHAYHEPGIHRTRVEVRDPEGLGDLAVVDVMVMDGVNTRPVADFSILPESGPQRTYFMFDASSSRDAEDPLSALFFRWDDTSDGQWDTSPSHSPIRSILIARPGRYRVTLEVIDTGGLAGTITREVVVTAVNSAPRAYFQVVPAVGTVDTEFRVDATGTYDAETPASSLEVRWDWEDDGTWDTPFSTDKAAQHRYDTTGPKTIVLEVRDAEGATDRESRTVTVTGLEPVANFTVAPSVGTTATVFSFDAGASLDAEYGTDALEVRWDWEDDGTWDTGFTTRKTATYRYGALGIFTVRLQVRNPAMRVAETSRELRVVPAQPPEGPNRGVLCVHSTDLAYTTGVDFAGLSGVACGQDADDLCPPYAPADGPVRCDVWVTNPTSTAAPGTYFVWYVLAAFGSECPRLKAVSFGLDYDRTRVNVVDAGFAADAFWVDLQAEDGQAFPGPGSGVGISFVDPRTSPLPEICWFAGYLYAGMDSTSISLREPPPPQTGLFIDDSVPPRANRIQDYGRLGLGGMEGDNPPPNGWW